MAVNFILRTFKRSMLRNYVPAKPRQLHFCSMNLSQCVLLGPVNGTFCNLFCRKICTTAWICTDSDSVSCWKCGVSIDLNKVLFCDYCEVVQKPKYDADYFTIFGIKKKFEIDNRELTKMFRLLQMQLHPDRFTQKSEVWFYSLKNIIHILIKT